MNFWSYYFKKIIAKFSSYCSLIFGHEDGQGMFEKSIRFIRCWLSFKSERVSPLRELTRINGSLMQSPLQQSDLESAIYCNLLRAMTRTTEIIAQCKSLHNFFLYKTVVQCLSAINGEKVPSALKSRFIAAGCTENSEKHHLKSNLNRKVNITSWNFFICTEIYWKGKFDIKHSCMLDMTSRTNSSDI